MNKVSRRKFLKQVAFGTGALNAGILVGYKALSPNVASAQGQLPPQNKGRRGGETEFIQGQVLSISGTTVAVDDTTKGLRTLTVSSDTIIWKGGVVTLQAIQPGDFLYARGLPMPDGTIGVLKMWINIVNVIGIVESYSSGRIRLRLTHLGVRILNRTMDVEISGDTIINNGLGGPQNIQVDRFIQVLGVLRQDGTLKATRVWAY